MLQVSVDATIAIAFGLAATIISLITIYIMWKDRSLRMSDSRRGEQSNLNPGYNIRGRLQDPDSFIRGHRNGRPTTSSA